MTRTAVVTAATELNERFDLPEKYDPAVPLAALVETGHNARRKYDAGKLDELAASIREKGIIEPLIVRPFALNGTATYEIVAGSRRCRASKIAGRNAVPCVIREYSDSDVLELQIVENLQREDLDPIDEAFGYAALIESDKSRYSAAYIADRIGRSEKYIWDTLRLLNLVPDAIAHLEAGRITRSHAVDLARLTKAQQTAIIDPAKGGLFVQSAARLEGIDDADGKPGTFDHVKAVSVKELERYIADHVRFDVTHAATTAPLEFGATAARVEAALAKPGRGKKVISIHFGHHVQESARDTGGERTFGHGTWKRADGLEDSKTCAAAVLGVVAVGEGYGQAFDVCVAKDTCDVHWKRERKDREATQKLRSSGKPKQAAAREDKLRAEREAEDKKREDARKAWAAAGPAILEALAGKVKTAKVARLGELLMSAFARSYGQAVDKRARALMPAPKTADAIVRLATFATLVPLVDGYRAASPAFIKLAKQLGVDINAIVKSQAAKAAAGK